MNIIAPNCKQKIIIFSDNLYNKNIALMEKLFKWIRTINISNNELSHLLWLDILNQLDLEFKDILFVDNKNIKAVINIESLTNAEWLSYIGQRKTYLKKPIIIENGKVKFLSKSQEIKILSQKTNKKPTIEAI